MELKKLSEIANDIVQVIPRRMTQKEKIARWAFIVESYRGDLWLFHGLEYMRPSDLREIRPCKNHHSALSVACKDPVLQSQGLSERSSIADVMKVMEINQQQLHEFSCDCGGPISNRSQADRINSLAR